MPPPYDLHRRSRPEPRSSRGRAFAVIGGLLLSSCFLCCGAGIFVGWRANSQAKKELSEANRLWDAGQKADAVVRYKAVLDRDLSSIPSEAERPTVYQRVIDYDLEMGNTDAARKMTEKAIDKKVDLSGGSKATNDLVALVRGERERKESDERARKEAEAKRKQEEREAERAAEAKRRKEEGEQRPRVSAVLLEVRDGPFRTANGLNTTMVYADWKNTGNRPIRAVYATIKVFDSQDRELYSPVDYAIYAVSNDKPGIAPGETYVEPKGEGHVLSPSVAKAAARFTIKITRVEEKGY